MTDEKAYPVCAVGQIVDHGSSPPDDKPCARRITHQNVSRFETATTWCTQPEGHAGQCSGPLPSILEPNDHGPNASMRRRW